MKLSRLVIPALFALAAPAFADPAVGLWKTAPDRKNLVSHIEVRHCGAALCGRILRAFDKQGNQVTTRNIGKELFWGLKPMGHGKYAGGTAWVPLLNVKARATAQVSGNRMTVRGCKGAICDSQVWSKL